MNTVRHILEIKGRDVWTISPGATVYDALRMMADKDIGALVVTQGDRLVGILSERDYARKVVLLGKTSRETPVSEIMTTTVYTVHPDQTVEECMAIMTHQRVRHLPVLDGDEIIGVISQGDVVNNIIHRQRETIKGLEERITSPGV